MVMPLAGTRIRRGACWPENSVRMSRHLLVAGQRIAGLLGVLCASPIIAVAALSIWLEDKGPVFYRQIRVGQNNKTFQLWKLRSMRVKSQGASITRSGDPRITQAGAVLRKYKLDELPQLWNVARGDMGFIGPRPEVPEYVDASNPIWRKVLQYKPGITNLAALLYRDEERLLARAPHPESYYRENLLPEKLQLDITYVKHRSLWTDVKLIFLTIYCSFFAGRLEPQAIRRILLQESRHDRI